MRIFLKKISTSITKYYTEDNLITKSLDIKQIDNTRYTTILTSFKETLSVFNIKKSSIKNSYR